MRTFRTYGLVAALAFALALAGCVQGAKQDPAALEGVQWTLQSSSEATADLSRFGIIAEFDGKQLAGFSGVNSYSGPYTAGADGSFSAGPARLDDDGWPTGSHGCRVRVLEAA